MLGCLHPEVMPICSHQCSPVQRACLKSNPKYGHVASWQQKHRALCHWLAARLHRGPRQDCSLTSTWFTACLAKLALPASSGLCACALSSVGAGLTGCSSMASAAVALEALHPMCQLPKTAGDCAAAACHQHHVCKGELWRQTDRLSDD